VNEPWVQLCGYTSEEVVGMDSRLLQGPKTEKAVVRAAVTDVMDTDNHSVEFETFNYKKGGKMFRNHVTLMMGDDASPVCVAKLEAAQA